MPAPQPDPSDTSLYQKTELGDIYKLPGEGFVVELVLDDTTCLFDKQGLQHRIIEKKRLGLDALAEETALSKINNFAPTVER